MKRVWSLLKYSWPIFVLVSIFLMLYVLNVKPNTWLIGWDNTMPELNMQLNLERILSAIWQEYRGLGFVDGMAHAANIMHWFYVWVLLKIVPQHLVRYLFVLLMHLCGGVGMYVLVRDRIAKAGSWVGLIGALIYMFNAAVLQMFFAPLELFVIHFGFLPWLMWSWTRFLEYGGKKKLALLLLMNLLAVSQAHVPTIFLVYLAGIFIVGGWWLVLYHNCQMLFRLAIGVVVIFLVNVFWLMPYVYTTLKAAPVVAGAKINRLSNYETVLRNTAFGDLKGVALMQSFNLDYIDWNGNKYSWQLDEWRAHLLSEHVETIGWFLFGLSLFGVVIIIWRRDWKNAAWIWIALMGWLALGMDVPIVGSVSGWLRANIPYFEQVFRFAFTKFSIIYALAYSLLITYSLTKAPLLFFRIGLRFVTIGVVIIIALPVFRGQFFYDQLQVNVPPAYMEAYGFFNSQNGRAALLPVPSFWGWEQYRWGYKGSGFVWQGISTPLLHRSFDPWSAENETFYNQVSYAVYLKDSTLLEQVLKKYQVRWLVMDESIFVPGGWEGVEYIKETERLLEQMDTIHEVKRWMVMDGRDLIVYKTDLGETQNYVWSPKSCQLINGETVYTRIDPIYAEVGDYIYNDQGVDYPFADITKEELDKTKAKSLIANIATDSANVLRVDMQNWGNKEVDNCDIFDRGSVGRIDNFGGGVSYVAKDRGAVCDHFYLPKLEYNNGYVMRVRGENVSGRSMKIFLTNNFTRHNDMELLMDKGLFEQYFVVLPQQISDSAQVGYTLNLEIRSFGREIAQNRIDEIEFYPISLQRGKEIEDFKLVNNLTIKDVKKYGTGHYVVEAEGDGLIALGQGYEEGWVAFSNWKKLDHVKVNGWSNGWMVPNGGKVVIVYWPQYLEWLGLLLLVVSPVLFLKHGVWKDRKLGRGTSTKIVN